MLEHQLLIKEMGADLSNAGLTKNDERRSERERHQVQGKKMDFYTNSCNKEFY